MKQSYNELLLRPEWQKKRLKIFERDAWLCQSCGRGDLTLHIHHKHYINGALPWQYHDNDLVTYCQTCHETEHLIGGQIHESLIDLIKDNPPLIKPLSQLCILSEKFPPFVERLRTFLNGEMIIYLQEMKNHEQRIFQP